ncbi:hypothetical protein CBS14141_000621 [Malassezia furfur]|nr:hypothetical protein CBS14141_000621 [Malassezia furfur]
MDEGGATAVRTALARLDLVPRGGVRVARYAAVRARACAQPARSAGAAARAAAGRAGDAAAPARGRVHAEHGVFVAAQDAMESVPTCATACAEAADAVATRHAPRVRAAAEKLAAAAPAALAERAARVRVEEAWDAGVGALVAQPCALEACVARGDDDEALRIARHVWTTCAPDDAVRRALLREVDASLAGMHARVLASLCAPQTPLPRVRRAARTLHELADVAASHGPPRAWAMRSDEVCAAFLAARYVGVERALRVRDVARSVDAWHDAVHAACVRRDARERACACRARGTSCAALGVPLDGVADAVVASAPALFAHALRGTARAARAAGADDLAWDAVRRGVTAALNALRVYAPEAVADEVRAALDAYLAEARGRWAPTRAEAWASLEARARAALQSIYGAEEPAVPAGAAARAAVAA